MADTYTTRSGDTWDIIAFRELGSCNRTDLLMDANRKHLGTAIFSAGTVLSLPEIESGSVTDALPPWRRRP